MEELMSFKVPGGWAVTYNQFFDLSVGNIPSGHVDLELFGEDLLQIMRMDPGEGSHIISEEGHFLIDLGWYPEADPKGNYSLKLAYVTPLKTPKWETITAFRSKDRFEIRDTLETWLAKLLPFRNEKKVDEILNCLGAKLS